MLTTGVYIASVAIAASAAYEYGSTSAPMNVFGELVSNDSDANSKGIVVPVAYRYMKRAANTMS